MVVHDALAGVANLPHSVGRFGDHQRTQVVGKPGIVVTSRRPVFAGFSPTVAINLILPGTFFFF